MPQDVPTTVSGAFCRAAGTLSGQDIDKTKFQMKWNTKFIDVARESKCRIINYPAVLQAANQIIGMRQFNVKRIKSATFEKFMSSLVDAHGTHATHDDDDVMQIVAWEQGTLVVWRLHIELNTWIFRRD
jgi:hypothetical protein